MQTEIEKRIEEAAYAYEVPRHFNCYGCCQSDSDYEKAFKAGAKFILELPELMDMVSLLRSYLKSDCVCREEFSFTCDACELIRKIKTLGIVNG